MLNVASTVIRGRAMADENRGVPHGQGAIYPDIDTKWFREQLKKSGKTQAAWARHMGVDPSGVSYLVRGKRRWHMQTIQQAADFLRVPAGEVARAVGLKMDIGGAHQKCRLIGTVDHYMVVQSNVHSAEVDGLSSMPADTVAVRVQTAGTPMDHMDGWLLYFQPSRNIDPSLVTRLCIAEMEDGSRRVGNLRRGYEPNTYNLNVAGEILENCRVANAMLVQWIRP